MLISLLFALPLLYVSQQFLREVSAGINIASKEIVGDAYLRPLRRLMEHLSLPILPAQEKTVEKTSALLAPRLASAGLTGREVSARINADMRALEEQEQAHGAELETSAAYQTLRADWRIYEQAANGGAAQPAAGFPVSSLLRPGQPHSPDVPLPDLPSLRAHLRGEAFALISHVGDTSTLILDPDLDSYYTMNGVVVDLPTCADLIAQTSEATQEVLGSRAAPVLLTGKQQARFLVLAGQLQQSADAAAHDNDISAHNNPSGILKPRLQKLYDEVAASHHALVTLLTACGSAKTFSVQDAALVAHAARTARRANDKLWNQAVDALDDLLRDRVSLYAQRRTRAEAFTAGMMLIVAYLYTAFYLAVMRTVSRLQSASAQMSSGDMDQVAMLPPDSRDEMAQVVVSFNTVAARLCREWKQAQEDKARATEAEERYRCVVEQVKEVIFTTSLAGEWTFLNPAWTAITGYDVAESLGRTFMESIFDEDRLQSRTVFEAMLRQESDYCHYQARCHVKEGGFRWIEARVQNTLDARGNHIGFFGTLGDITERKHAEEQLHHQALHDALTGLPNRLLFQDRLKWALKRGQRSQKAAAVLFVDLDNFKVINDSMGHEAGDTLLKEVSARLQAATRSEDTTARLGGDEFTLLLEGLQKVEEAVEVAERIVAHLQQPIRVGERDVFASASIGIAYSADPLALSEDLMRNADAAMYYAKAAGKSGYVLFNAGMNSVVSERLEIETDLRFALEREELRVFYQPLIDLATGEMSGVEALLRWEHPALGLMAPGKFIAIAEETGLIIPIGYWVLEEACRQAQAWKAAHPDQAAFTLNVNLSGKQLQRADVVERVRNIITRAGMDARCLKLEITESVMMADVEDTVAKLSALKALGVQLAMDDFGTGYSSIASLNLFPLDTVKIDRSFVARLAEHEEAQSVIAAIVMLSKALNLNITGEGIETEEQREYLQGLGCHIGQGYYFDRPLAAEALEARMTRDQKSCSHEGTEQTGFADVRLLAA